MQRCKSAKVVLGPEPGLGLGLVIELKGRPETGINAADTLGRAVIAMTAVRIGTLVQAGKVTDHPDIRPPTDVMAITSLPYVRR